MKIGFIVVYYHTSLIAKVQFRARIKSLGVKEYHLYEHDNTKDNIGFAGGANVEIQKALSDGCDIVILCNSDIHFPKKTAFEKILLEGAKEFDIWGGEMHQNGTVYYGGELDAVRMSGGLIQNKPSERFSKVDFVSGSFFIIKREVIEKIGLLKKDYFLYYEDVEYCMRALRKGFAVGIDTKLSYHHDEHSETNNPGKKWWLAKNRLMFMLQYGTLSQKLSELIYLPKTVTDLLKGQQMKSPFFFNFMTLNVSSIITKVINFVLFLVLINQLPVSAYGIYTLVWAHISLLAPFLDLGTTTYGLIQLPQERIQKIVDLMSLRFILSLCITAITVGLAVLFGYPKYIFFLIVLLTTSILSNGVSGTYLIVSSIHEKSYRAAIVSIIFQTIQLVLLVFVIFTTQSLASVFTTFFFMYLSYTVVFLYLLYLDLGTYGLLKNVEIQTFTRGLRYLWPSWVDIMKKSYTYVFIGFFAGLYYKADIFMLNALKGETAVGIYSAGYKFFDAFLFIAASYNIAASPVMSKLSKKSFGDIQKKIRRDLLLVAPLGLFVSIIMWIACPYVLPFILKQPYADTVPVLRIVIWALPLILCSSVILNVLYVYKKSQWVVWLFGLQVVVTIGLNYIFIPRYSYYASATLTVVSELINLCILLFLYQKLVKERSKLLNTRFNKILQPFIDLFSKKIL